MKRQSVSSNEALAMLSKHVARGLHVDTRLFNEINQPGSISLLTLDTQEEFFSLVWQKNKDTQLLTPTGKPRSLWDCANQLVSHCWRFEDIVAMGYPWFERCIAIDQAFDIDKFDWLSVTTLTGKEKKESPIGNYYVYDGVHRSIVLAKKLVRREIEYSPRKALLLEPRRH